MGEKDSSEKRRVSCRGLTISKSSENALMMVESKEVDALRAFLSFEFLINSMTLLS